MGIYAKRPAKMIGQLFGDGFVLLWTVGWAIVGIFVHRVIEVLATPARETARTATRLAENFREAAAEAAKVPVAGEQLRRPLDAAAVTLGNLITSANDQVASIERLALIGGWVVFGIPVAIVVALWLPRRVRFYRQARASQVFLDSTADLDLFALRAMASQPLYVLAAVSDDPVKAWLAGDRQVIDALAAIELRRNGLRLPKNRLEVST
jgi:NADPH-dependent glutamate synthase beta subunit-like oxidoreductase